MTEVEGVAKPPTPQAKPTGPPPDALLNKLYGSTLPAQELVKGLPLSAIVGACLPNGSGQALLKQSWLPQPSEDAADAVPPPAFDPTAAIYTLIPSRLTKSKALLEMNRCKIAIGAAQADLAKCEKADPNMEALQAALEELKGKYDEASAALAETKAAIAEDPTSLVPWMSSLFAQADMGVTTFTAEGAFWPHCDPAAAFAPGDGKAITEAAELVLAAFRKRIEAERGPGAIQVVLRFAPNVFREGFGPAAVAAAVSRMLESQGIDPEGGGQASLDAVELVWWDSKAHSPVSTLKQLAKLCENETETDAESGEVTVTSARKIKALGVNGFSAEDMLAAIMAGVKISFAHCRFGLHASKQSAEVVSLCKQYGIKVLGSEGTMCGLIDEAFIGVPCPSVTDAKPLLRQIKNASALIDDYGGWHEVQKLLVAVKAVADKHAVTMQSVALRWQMDHGVVPVVPTAWLPDVGASFGHPGSAPFPPVDAKLMQANTFLDAADMAALHAVVK